MKIDDIQPNPDNPRQIKKEQFQSLLKSVKEFEKMMALRPIVVDAEGIILGGNMRYEALKHLGYTDIPDEWIKRADDLTDAEKRRFIIADNQPFGEWDMDVLANDWDVQELENWGLDLPGMDDWDAGEEDGADAEPQDETKKTVTCPKCGEVIATE